MLEFIVEVLATLFVGGSGGGRSPREERRQLRRWAKAHADGQDVTFQGFAQGPVAYQPSLGPGGVLVLTGGELFWTPDGGFGRALWRRIPTERLVVERRTHGAAPYDAESWPGYECLDQGRAVVILCEPLAEPYLRIALGLPELDEEPVTDARVDPEFWSWPLGAPVPEPLEGVTGLTRPPLAVLDQKHFAEGAT